MSIFGKKQPIRGLKSCCMLCSCLVEPKENCTLWRTLCFGWIWQPPWDVSNDECATALISISDRLLLLHGNGRLRGAIHFGECVYSCWDLDEKIDNALLFIVQVKQTRYNNVLISPFLEIIGRPGLTRRHILQLWMETEFISELKPWQPTVETRRQNCSPAHFSASIRALTHPTPPNMNIN